MRFRYKVIMINIAFLSFALGILGFIMIYKNFNQALRIQMDYAIAENNLIQSSIEYQLLDSLNQNNINLSKQLAEAGKDTASQLLTGGSYLYIFYKDALCYTNDSAIQPQGISENSQAAAAEVELSEQTFIPKSLLSSLELGNKDYITMQENDSYYLYIAARSILEENDLYIITKRNVSDTYALLDSQIRSFLLLMIIVLVVCSVFLHFISTRLTQPLEQLNAVTDNIAQGDYHIQAEIASDDEIGMLAEKFNAMTLAISRHIEELNLMVKQREQFVADFTHEIKTPMTTIIGYADTLRSKPLSADRQKLAYDYIYSEGKRLETMSMKLFDLIYLRDNELVKSEIQTADMAKEITGSMQPILDRKEIRLITNVASAVIYGDLDLLKTVFINLIDNAKKASEPKSNVYFRGYRKEDFYLFEVEDHGCGMDAETTRHICDEFYMADKSRSRAEGGAGLGMSLSSVIIQKHGFSLEIESEPGEGSVFTVVIPLKAAPLS